MSRLKQKKKLKKMGNALATTVLQKGDTEYYSSLRELRVPETHVVANVNPRAQNKSVHECARPGYSVLRSLYASSEALSSTSPTAKGTHLSASVAGALHAHNSRKRTQGFVPHTLCDVSACRPRLRTNGQAPCRRPPVHVLCTVQATGHQHLFCILGHLPPGGVLCLLEAWGRQQNLVSPSAVVMA